VKQFVVILATVVVVSVTAAFAKTGAHGATKVATIRAAFGRQAPAKCYDAYISTVDGSWASAYYAGSVKAPCVRWGSNGIVLMHSSHKHWHVVTEGSSFRCPVRGVPNRIERDLVPAPKCH
jgi:hypothetical protein